MRLLVIALTSSLVLCGAARTLHGTPLAAGAAPPVDSPKKMLPSRDEEDESPLLGTVEASEQRGESEAVLIPTNVSATREADTVSKMSAKRRKPRKMPSATQRAFVTRDKRQNREDHCHCCRCYDDAYASAPQGDDFEQQPPDYSRAFAPPAPFTPGGDDSRRRRDFFPSDFPAFARRSSRENSPFTSASGQWQAPGPRRRFNPFPGYAPPPPSPPRAGVPYRATPATPPLLVERDPYYNPLPTIQKGGPMRGTGTFARALRMKSPIPWIRNWQTGLGSDSKYYTISDLPR